ncbi:hypothetical protein ACJRPK_15245 [Aquimarina sp. 2-A2]|uniref:hypothetical protein n=1 Tax=Aquimarina sp. 2-A2 TaxID=3382644 RepID=UPI00387EF18B
MRKVLIYMFILCYTINNYAQNNETSRDKTPVNPEENDTSLLVNINQGSTQLSIKNSGDFFNVKATFKDKEKKKVRLLLESHLGDGIFDKSNYIWIKKSSDQLYYRIVLSDNKLDMFFDKALNSEMFYEKFSQMSNDLNKILLKEKSK